MSLIWYLFMERSHDIDTFLDNRIECLANQVGVPYIKNVTDRCVTVSGGCMVYATVFVIAAVYPAVLLIRLGLGYVNLISSIPLVLIVVRRFCSYCHWKRREHDQRSPREPGFVNWIRSVLSALRRLCFCCHWKRRKPDEPCSQCHDRVCTRVRGCPTHCCASCHLGGAPQQQGSQCPGMNSACTEAPDEAP